MELYTDGSLRFTDEMCREGYAGAGMVLLNGEKEVFTHSQQLGVMSCVSLVEAKALLEGLRLAKPHCSSISVKCDRKDVVDVVNKKAKFRTNGVYHIQMLSLMCEIEEVIKGYDSVSIEWVPRKENPADLPAKMASKAQRKCSRGQV